jgi:hypothetical protein
VLVEFLEDCLGVVLFYLGFEDGIELVAVLDAVRIGGEPVIVDERLPAERRTEVGPDMLGGDGDNDVPVAGAKRPVRDDRRVFATHACRRLAARKVAGSHVRHPGNLPVEQTDVDFLAGAVAQFPVEKCRDDRLRGVHPGSDVGDGDADPDRRAVFHPGDAHHPRLGLHDDVVRRPVLVGPPFPVSRHRTVDQTGVVLCEVPVPEPPLVHLADAEVLDEDVGVASEVAEHLASVLAREVERHRALVAVDARVVRAHLAVAEGRRVPAPRLITAPRAFDLDDVRPEVAQLHRTERANEDPRGVENCDTI